MLTLLASFVVRDPIMLMIEFILLVCLIAVVIILGKWLLSLTGLVIPGPLMTVLAILVFVLLLLLFLDFTGLWAWGPR